MSSVEEQKISTPVDAAVEEPAKEAVETKIQSPWEEVVIVPGSARIQNGRKLPTLTDVLKNPKKNNSLAQGKPKIEVDASLKPENKEQWNPVDLSHLLITDAVSKPVRNSNNKRNNSNNSSKRNSKNTQSSRTNKAADGKEYTNKRSDGKFDKSQSRSNKKSETDREYKKKPVNKSTSNRKTDGKRFKVIDSASSTEYSQSSTSEGSSVGNSSEDKPREDKPYVKSDKPYYKKEYNGEYKPRNHENSNYKSYGYQKKNGSRPYNKYNRSQYYQNPPNVPVLPKSYDYETYYKCAKQMAYYLSVENLNKDTYLVENLMDKYGYIQLSSLVNFKLLKIASKEGNFEIIMTALYMILANQLGLSHEDKIDIGLLANTSEYIGTDQFGVQFAYDYYVLRNRSWSIPTEVREKMTKVFKPVFQFHAYDFYSYSIQKPEEPKQPEEEAEQVQQQPEEEEKPVEA